MKFDKKQPSLKQEMLSGVPEGIPEKTAHTDHPYMGDLTSHQIGMMAKSGQLGGEMVKRMIQREEEQMANKDSME